MSAWVKYRRSNLVEIRPYVPGEDLTNINVSLPDSCLSMQDSAAFDLGMVARNPKDHTDKWYMSRAHFEANYEPIGE
jgi:hypothetical protein